MILRKGKAEGRQPSQAPDVPPPCLGVSGALPRKSACCPYGTPQPSLLLPATLGRGVVVRVGVALTAVLHQEGRVVPGHAEDAIRLVQEDVGQHPAMAVHDDHLPISCAKQHLQATTRTPDG